MILGQSIETKARLATGRLRSRLRLEIALALAVKLAVLVAIYSYFFAPANHPAHDANANTQAIFGAAVAPNPVR